jgi:hypothetical protein
VGTAPWWVFMKKRLPKVKKVMISKSDNHLAGSFEKH